MLSLSVRLVWTVKLIWDWGSEWVHQDGSESDTPLQGPGAGSSLGRSCHFLLRFSRDPAASWLSGVLVLSGGSQRPRAAWHLRRARGPPCSGFALFFKEADDGPGKRVKESRGEAVSLGLGKFTFIPWVSEHLWEGWHLECDGGVSGGIIHRG